MIPEVLKKGDEIRVIAPSRSMSVLNENVVDLAKEKLEELGFKVTFGKNVLNYESEYFKCGKIVKLNFSYYIIDNQVTRSLILDYELNKRKKSLEK